MTEDRDEKAAPYIWSAIGTRDANFFSRTDAIRLTQYATMINEFHTLDGDCYRQVPAMTVSLSLWSI
jgi:hypothetical protein